MAFNERLRKQMFKLDKGTCQNDNCFGYDYEGYARSMPDDWDGIPLPNGGFMVQGSHVNRRDYHGFDRDLFNPDGTRRGELECTWCHLRHDALELCQPHLAAKLALDQTTYTYRRIMQEGEDLDIPLGIFTDIETRRLNNERRDILKGVLLRKYGYLLQDPSRQFIMDMAAK